MTSRERLESGCSFPPNDFMIRLLLSTYALLLVLPLQAGVLSGTYAVGPSGDYASISAALSAIQTNGLSGPVVLELQAAYTSSLETFPLTFSNLGTSATNTLTLRPQAGATALSISSADTTAATVDLNGAQYVTIDGRPGGAGSNAGSGGGAASQLTIANTSTSGVALRFINEAGSNTVCYTTLRSVNTSATSGTVVFSTTTGANGNDGNTLDHCDLGDGASTPTNGLYSLGTTSSSVKNNSANTVSNCNLFNFYAATAVDAAGLRLDGGNNGWTITGNSFYQTASRAAVAANVRAIYLKNSSGNTFVVMGNWIGGSAPNAGGSAWTTTGTTAAYQFQGIWLSVGSTTPSSVQGNTIQNFVWTSSYASIGHPGVWCGIYVLGGSVNVGTVTGNTIGSGTGTGSISTTTSGNGGTTFGIASESATSLSICNNTIGSMTVNSTASNVSALLTGIYTLQGKPIIRNNLVGSLTTASSLNAATSATSGHIVTGILCSTDGATIADNTLANFNNNTTGAGYVHGIETYSGTNAVTGNVVRNFSTTSTSTATDYTQAASGIVIRIDLGGQAVSQNVVHSLRSTAASASVCVTGIYYSGGGTVISRNLVHSLAVASTSASSQVNGMWLVTSSSTAQNNMVRLGLDANGAATAAASVVRGIYDNGTSAGRNFYHNTVYIGGTQASGAASTFAFDGTTSVTSAHTYQNNIFVNARSNAGGTGKHYAVRYGGAVANPAGLNAGGNILFVNGIGAHLGLYNGVDQDTLRAWQVATGQDTTSAFVGPLFVNPTGNVATFDLHLQSSNPAAGGGIPIAVVTDDFDGQARSTLTPADIGADAGSFTSSSGDIYAPAITYPLLINGSAVNRVLTGWATIQDNSGSVAGGANVPRLYFKKGTDADAFGVLNSASGNGWKYVTATNSSSPYSFVLDYSLLNGGGVTAGDTVQYFVVAQDVDNNFGSSPAAAVASTNPTVQNVVTKPAVGVNSYNIGAALGGTKTVGSGGDYATLSGAGGLFAAINGGVLTGNLIINITSDVTEDGSVSLNPWLEEGTGGYTLTIRSDSATMRTISGNVNAGLITLNGADRVIIDGSFGGSGRYLTFRNLSSGTSACTLRFASDASGNSVSNCVVEGATKSTTLGVIGFSAAVTTGNNNNLITGCQVRDLSTTAGVPNKLIGVASSSVSSSGNTLSNNELFNFNQHGISIAASGSGPWTISGNDIYEVNAATSSNIGISFLGGGTHVISGNFIHDLLTTSFQSTGIFCQGRGAAKLKGNRITAFNVNPSTTSVYGIQANVSSPVGDMFLDVVNNQITLIPAAVMSTSLYGLYSDATDSPLYGMNACYNSVVLGGSESGDNSSWACLSENSSVYSVSNNLFLNLRTGGTGSHYAFGGQPFSYFYSVIPFSNNVYAGTGANPDEFMYYYYSGMNFAAWQSYTQDKNSQAGIASTGNFTTAMFVDAAHGDLHLVPGGNALVNAKGIPVAGYTDDFDGDLRPSGTPNVGSDQQPFADLSVSSWTSLADGGNTGFGGVIVGAGSYTQAFTVTNPGNVDLTGLTLSLDGANAADFTVSNLSAVSIPAGGTSATFSVTFTPHAVGASNAAVHLSANESGTRLPFDINLFGVGIITVGTWRQQHFGDTANTGSGADTFDYDNDGLPNLVEWACNLNPTTASTLPATAVINGTNMEFTYTRSLSALYAGTVFTVEWSDAPGTAWQSTGVSISVLSSDSNVQQVKATLPVGTSGHRFVRLKVTAPP
jgi:hypothetical protein